jgi:hypothetical protein
MAVEGGQKGVSTYSGEHGEQCIMQVYIPMQDPSKMLLTNSVLCNATLPAAMSNEMHATSV